MAYRDLRKIFHGYPKTYATEYESRFNSDQSHKVGFRRIREPCVFVMTPEIYQAAIDAQNRQRDLPAHFSLCLGKRYKAIESNLIDEIVITNEIEGVRSTRREIGGVLERLEETTNVDASTVLFKIPNAEPRGRHRNLHLRRCQKHIRRLGLGRGCTRQSGSRSRREPLFQKRPCISMQTPPVSPFTREWSQNRRSLFALRKRSIF